jgi:hypothetical protein
MSFVLRTSGLGAAQEEQVRVLRPASPRNSYIKLQLAVHGDNLSGPVRDPRPTRRGYQRLGYEIRRHSPWRGLISQAFRTASNSDTRSTRYRSPSTSDLSPAWIRPGQGQSPGKAYPNSLQPVVDAKIIYTCAAYPQR